MSFLHAEAAGLGLPNAINCEGDDQQAAQLPPQGSQGFASMVYHRPGRRGEQDTDNPAPERIDQPAEQQVDLNRADGVQRNAQVAEQPAEAAKRSAEQSTENEPVGVLTKLGGCLCFCKLLCPGNRIPVGVVTPPSSRAGEEERPPSPQQGIQMFYKRGSRPEDYMQ